MDYYRYGPLVEDKRDNKLYNVICINQQKRRKTNGAKKSDAAVMPYMCGYVDRQNVQPKHNGDYSSRQSK